MIHVIGTTEKCPSILMLGLTAEELDRLRRGDCIGREIYLRVSKDGPVPFDSGEYGSGWTVWVIVTGGETHQAVVDKVHSEVDDARISVRGWDEREADYSA
jgi:hypothetical protein